MEAETGQECRTILAGGCHSLMDAFHPIHQVGNTSTGGDEYKNGQLWWIDSSGKGGKIFFFPFISFFFFFFFIFIFFFLDVVNVSKKKIWNTTDDKKEKRFDWCWSLDYAQMGNDWIWYISNKKERENSLNEFWMFQSELIEPKVQRLSKIPWDSLGFFMILYDSLWFFGMFWANGSKPLIVTKWNSNNGAISGQWQRHPPESPIKECDRKTTELSRKNRRSRPSRLLPNSLKDESISSQLEIVLIPDIGCHRRTPTPRAVRTYQFVPSRLDSHLSRSSWRWGQAKLTNAMVKDGRTLRIWTLIPKTWMQIRSRAFNLVIAWHVSDPRSRLRE